MKKHTLAQRKVRAGKTNMKKKKKYGDTNTERRIEGPGTKAKYDGVKMRSLPSAEHFNTETANLNSF